MMQATPQHTGFKLSISASEDGAVQAIYISLRNTKVARTKEIEEDILLADYDSKGRLVGIEILAPVQLKIITRLVDEPRRKPFRRFVRDQAPDDLVLA